MLLTDTAYTGLAILATAAASEILSTVDAGGSQLFSLLSIIRLSMDLQYKDKLSDLAEFVVMCTCAC